MAHDTRGPRFEREVLKTLNGMDIECYGTDGQIPLRNLYPGSASGEHLEIDIVCLVENICILVETTVEKEIDSKKIKRFISHCELFIGSSLPKSELFSHFKIPKKKLVNFSGITDWRYLYIGKNPEFITTTKYPKTNRLHIFNMENWEYFKILQRTIKETAKYELFASVNIEPTDIGDSSLGGYVLTKPCLELTNKTLFSGQNRVFADLFVVIFTPKELLRIARVLRYQGQPLAISSGTSTDQQSGGYQRILIPDKLKKIREFINEDQRVAFPTNLTLVLSNECEMKNGELHIPSKYASIDVIDGQHRLFSYAKSNKQVQNKASLIATAIKFEMSNEEKINRYAASTFITINSEQTKVKQDLIYLISYDVLDDKTPEAIAAKILMECDSKDNGVLSRIFSLKAFIKKNKFDQTPIPIISIIKELARIFKPENLEKIKGTLGEHGKELNETEPLIQAGRQLLEHYFSHIKSELSDDWGSPDSLLMCAKYIGAFVRLLNTFIEENLTVQEMRQELAKIRKNILTEYNKGRTEGKGFIFDPSAFHTYTNEEGKEINKPLPSKREGSIEKIHKFLNENRNDNLQS